MPTIVNKVPLSGRVIPLSTDDVYSPELINSLSKTVDTPIIVATPDGGSIEGVVAYSDTDEKYFMLFPDDVVIPEGSCIELGVVEKQPDCDDGCSIVKAEVTKDTKLAVLDGNGCPTNKFITVEDIAHAILGSDCIVPAGESNLVSGDSIVAISGDCKLKRVAASSVKC